jgi:hypothetical protein
MISYVDGDLYVKVPTGAIDGMVIAMLKEGRDGVQYSISGILSRVAEAGEIRPHHVADLTDNIKYLDAFNTLLDFYGDQE